MRVRDKLTLLVLLASTLPVVVLSVLSFSAAKRNLQEMIGGNLLTASREIIHNLEGDLIRSAENITAWADLAVMQDVMTDDGDGAIQRQLEALKARFPLFGELTVLSDKGEVLASTMAGAKGSSQAQHPAYVEARKGRFATLPVEQTPFARGLSLTMAAPLPASYDPKTVIGVLVGSINWGKVQTDLAETPIFGAKQDADHMLVLHGPGGSLLYATPGLPEFEAQGMHRPEGFDETDLKGAPVLVGTSRAKPAPLLGDLEWHVHAIISAAAGYEPINNLRTQALVMGLLLLTVVIALGALAARAFVAPITAVTGALLRVAKGEIDVTVDIRKSNDEIGQLAHALHVFRDSAKETIQLRHAQEEQRQRAAENLKAEMLALTEVLNSEIQETVGDISEQAARLSEGATQLSDVARSLRSAGMTVTESIHTTSGNVQTVAGAAEELEASSRAITDQVLNSTRLSGTARERVDVASRQVAGLTEAVARIGDVVGMIRFIAGQTRMLALNATIEAARAGQAGLGFVVVADEVKGLARQTEENIGTVNAQADAIGRTTRETVVTVEAVASAIRDIDAIAAEVAHAAEEQRSATAEIMGSASQAAEHTRAVAECVGSMMEDVEATSATARRVNELSGMVSRDIAALQRRMMVILRTSYGGDRRAHPRIPMALPFQGRFGDATFSGYTGDTSPQGALLVTAGAERPSADGGNIELEGVGRIDVKLARVSPVGLHVQFKATTPEQQAELTRCTTKAEQENQVFIDLVQGVAVRAAAALERALQEGRITLENLFDTEYRAIEGTAPQQVLTNHTELAEALFPPLIEPALASDQRIVFCAVTDRNGYIAAHNRKYSEPQRPDDPIWNAAHCRNRRIFDDRTGIVAARSTKPVLVQTYARDMGGGNFVLLKEIDAPIPVAQRHWGAVRMAIKLSA